MRTFVRGRVRGIALAIALVVVSIVLVLAYGLLSLGIQNLNHADAHRYSDKALYAAEAGAVEALRRLEQDTTWTGQGLGEATSLASGPETYEVEVVNNLAGSESILASNGASVAPGAAYLLATGKARTGDFARRVGVTVRPGPVQQLFRYAVFGYERLDVGNGNIDSYDSEEGSYQYTRSPDGGNVGTNSEIAPEQGGVTIGPQGSVDQIDIGPAGDCTLCVVCRGQNRGVRNLEQPLPVDTRLLEPPSLPFWGDVSLKKDGTLAPGAYGDAAIGGNARVVLAPGDYRFETLTVAGGASLVVSEGAVRLYVTGDENQVHGTELSVAGDSLVNLTGAPGNLKLLVGADVENIAIRGGPTVGMALYAPFSNLTLDGAAGDFYGAAVAARITMAGNGRFHYDRALARSGEGWNGPPEVVSWQRL
ncbi:MAG: hypothetical protein HY319_05930 [Armatimonadetes bacterium]|nr:hypothetical protein [Armatimonadota bacterium]